MIAAKQSQSVRIGLRHPHSPSQQAVFEPAIQSRQPVARAQVICRRVILMMMNQQSTAAAQQYQPEPGSESRVWFDGNDGSRLQSPADPGRVQMPQQ